MPANATRQIAKTSGGDSTSSKTTRDAVQEQLGESKKVQASSGTRDGIETREASSTRDDNSTAQRDGTSTSVDTRAQTTTEDSKQTTQATEKSVQVTPTVIKHTKVSGGAQTSVAPDDLAMQITFTLEVTSALCKC